MSGRPINDPVRTIWRPAPAIDTRRFNRDGETHRADLVVGPDQRRTWQITPDIDEGGVEILAVVADNLDQAAADLERVAEIQRAYAQPYLDRAAEADRQRALVEALAAGLNGTAEPIVEEAVVKG